MDGEAAMPMGDSVKHSEMMMTEMTKVPPFESDAKCCMCIDLKTGINIMICFGIFDILHLIGNVFWAIYYNVNYSTVYHDHQKLPPAAARM